MVNYLRIIIDQGKIIKKIPWVLENRYNELLCAGVKQLNLYDQPLAAGALPSPGNASLWAPKLAASPRRTRSCFCSTTSCIQKGKQQVRLLHQLVEGPVLTQFTPKIAPAELPAQRSTAELGEAFFADYAVAIIAFSDLAFSDPRRRPRCDPPEAIPQRAT